MIRFGRERSVSIKFNGRAHFTAGTHALPLPSLSSWLPLLLLLLLPEHRVDKELTLLWKMRSTFTSPKIISETSEQPLACKIACSRIFIVFRLFFFSFCCVTHTRTHTSVMHDGSYTNFAIANGNFCLPIRNARRCEKHTVCACSPFR